MFFTTSHRQIANEIKLNSPQNHESFNVETLPVLSPSYHGNRSPVNSHCDNKLIPRCLMSLALSDCEEGRVF